MLGAVHTTGLPSAIANTEKVEIARNAGNKVLPLNVMNAVTSESTTRLGIGRGEAHVSGGRFRGEDKAPFGAQKVSRSS
jgi:hypothetical protein